MLSQPRHYCSSRSSRYTSGIGMLDGHSKGRIDWTLVAKRKHLCPASVEPDGNEDDDDDVDNSCKFFIYLRAY
jgi:hypothetical protein